MKIHQLFIAALLISTSMAGVANEAKSQDGAHGAKKAGPNKTAKGDKKDEGKQFLMEKLQIPASAITDSASPELYQIQKGPAFGYATKDGTWVIMGDLINIRTQSSITENIRIAQRLAALKNLGDADVAFLPANPKYVVSAFVDIDCGFCRKMHAEMQTYLDKGIGFKYYFFPRSGPGTESWHKAEQAWCSKDKKKAVTDVYLGKTLPEVLSCINPVERSFNLGNELGVSGTPTLILPDGRLVVGYHPADDLLKILQTKP